MARKTPEINSGSMADIAFLLLIFWLVTTSMNVDSGIARKLPPLVEQENDPGMDARERNVLMVFVSGNNQLMVAGQRMDISGLCEKAKAFITNPTNDPSMPEKEMTEIPLLGNYPVSKGLISLQNDRSTSYDTYIQVQNELTKAFNEAKNELALQRFGRPLEDLSDAQKQAVNKAIPVKISEAEPRDLTGGR
ncbi:ExbD/TolR family protein [Millionella massiliensis]|uniref:Biopolymer transporter ExbD n=1 Tax=Candidatus Rikenella faecigallinarum TaxID=2838745 RepID=A0A9D1QDR8_9BACT|nr:biopolymer transporter ExbD [Millionella massiliensis]HIW11485.1 biopolymer transporter ExbD [Candidatus Rikenella faecigallinarum]